MTVTIGSLCTGYGGLDLAVQKVFDATLAWWSDIEPGPIAVMNHHHPDIPNLGDIRTVNWATVEPVDILTAGYPCQPFSDAGKRLGTADPRHLWPWIKTAIGSLRPRIVVLENVPGHLRRGFDTVSADLADLGYRLTWGIVAASEVGAPHLRKRLFVVAEDADSAASNQRRLAASGEEEAGGGMAQPSPMKSSGLLPTPHANCATGPGRQGREGGMNLQTATNLLTHKEIPDAS
ncbi:DNA cytosine methyltransferase [Amycolatopsis sp. NPDC021455]|uniref:DNA cytosine methyltransferase n=1 Tax=Amycolatopsis sp. NPDC021455 TaxID=3154901 RepID=UPI0033FA94DC